VNTAAAIVLVLLVALPVVFVAGLFVWAASKDGQEDKAVQARLGIRRRTRLGREPGGTSRPSEHVCRSYA
jgi:hypothetical protein